MYCAFTRFAAHSLALVAFLGALNSLAAETGMALVLDVGAGGDRLWEPGNIRRIDLKDDQVIKQTDSFGKGYSPRFSPNGDKFAYISGGKVYVADLDGNTLAEASHGFSNGDGKSVSVSYVPLGIYVWGDMKIKVYDESGSVTKEISLSGGRKGQIDYAGRWGIASDDKLVDLSNGKVVWTTSGCSYGISRDGTRFTKNLWESGKEHETMYVYRNNGGSVSQDLYLNIHTALGLGSGWVWNHQKWAGNTNDIITVPAGKESNNQISGNIDPWIYNISTKKAWNLKGSRGGTIYWVIYDYYHGKVPGSGPATVASPRLTPNGGEFTGTSVSVTMTTATPGASIRYTADGSVPTATHGTPIAGGQTVTVSLTSGQTTTVKAIAYKDDMNASAVVTAAYSAIEMRAPNNPTGIVQGLRYTYYEGTWSALPDFGSLTPVATGTLDRFTIAGFTGESYGVLFEGYVDVGSTGTYTFYTNSDDGSRLYIGDVLVVNNDGTHNNTEKPGTIGLAAGTHAVRVEYFQAGGGASLTVSYAGPGPAAKAEVPSNALYHVAQVESNIAVLSPNGGETFAAPETVTITWTATSDIVDVALAFSPDNGKTWLSIVDRAIDRSDPGWSKFAWEIPPAIDGTATVTNQGLIRVSDYQGSTSDRSDAAFSVSSGATVARFRRTASSGIRLMRRADVLEIRLAGRGRASAVVVRPNGRVVQRCANAASAMISTDRLGAAHYLIAVYPEAGASSGTVVRCPVLP